jgi:beta-N-acetylhexosaminidase
MKKKFLAFAVIFILVGTLLTLGCGRAENAVDQDLSQLSQEQKVGQLFMVGIQGTELTPELLQTIHPGGVILFARNIQDAGQLGKLIEDLQGVATGDTGYPLFIATDQEGGEIVRIKWLDDGVSEADITSTDQAYDIGLERGRGLKELGINQNLAPVLDIGQAGDFLTRYGRCFTGSPRVVGELGASVISGQEAGGIFSTAKHFPGYGGVDFDPENDRIPVFPQLPETSGPEFIMTANVIYSDIDADVPFTLTTRGIDYLRDQLEGDYLVITDDLASKVLRDAYTMAGTTLMAARAGVDVLLVSANQPEDPMAAYEALLQAVLNGEVSIEEVNKRVERILRLKGRLSE